MNETKKELKCQEKSGVEILFIVHRHYYYCLHHKSDRCFCLPVDCHMFFLFPFCPSLVQINKSVFVVALGRRTNERTNRHRQFLMHPIIISDKFINLFLLVWFPRWRWPVRPPAIPNSYVNWFANDNLTKWKMFCECTFVCSCVCCVCAQRNTSDKNSRQARTKEMQAKRNPTR